MKRSNFEVLSDGVLCRLTFCGHQIFCACYQPVRRDAALRPRCLGGVGLGDSTNGTSSDIFRNWVVTCIVVGLVVRNKTAEVDNNAR